jgi:Restriction Endonuclease associating with ARP
VTRARRCRSGRCEARCLLPAPRPASPAASIRFTELTRLEPDRDGRLSELSQLILRTIGDATLVRCLEDVARGDGRELEWTVAPDGQPRPPSLHSVFSSCCAALNTFGPWRLDPQTLDLVGQNGFDELRLEEKLRVFRGGRAPNLDSVLWDGQRLVAVESKLCEHLAPGHPAHLKESYHRVAPVAHESWAKLFALLTQEPHHFTYLDAAQLVRHYLGIRTQIAAKRSHARKTATLVYLYWEPTNAESHLACLAHRREVEELRNLVDDPAIPFVALSHRELWERWEEHAQRSWLPEHVPVLRERYAVSVT